MTGSIILKINQLCTDSISITLFSNYVQIVFQLLYFQIMYR